MNNKDYTRPELNEKDIIEGHTYAAALLRKYGMGKLFALLNMLIAENLRLLKEIQEHRAARGIAPLETFKV